MDTSEYEMGAAGTRVQLSVEPGVQSRQFDNPTTREACKCRSHQFVEAHEGGSGIPWKHTYRDAAPLGKAEWPARPHMQRELVDLNEMIREMMLLLHDEATQFAVLARTELTADLPQVVGDRVQLQQVLMNLMMNSIDAMKDVDGARELTIKSQRGENGQVLVSVSDTGVGLPPQHADQIFNAFFTTKPNGTGMGLRISISIVESHGGRLWASDNSPRGAIFQFTLPDATAAAHR
jgi:signal transduction histidine kinase